ncbi:MAG: zinc ribbon domain-containing protein, partial [Defluviitaleaceae bacterium]|nr:zinc ribbon domain-containing protein [Defluviitaleaceae bacterium]
TDGSRSGEYCSYCFADGNFTSQMNFEQAVEVNLPFWREGFDNDDDARQKIREVFSQLKRWQNQN